MVASLASSDLTLKIVLFSMIVNLVFPVFAYSFTTITGSDFESLDISISQESLINAGLQFSSAQSLNVTYEAAPELATFNISDRLLRVRWFHDALWGDRFRFTRPSLIEYTVGEITGDYFSLGGEALTAESNGFYYTHDFYNSTMVSNYDPDYNWTMVTITQAGLTILFSTIPGDAGNITQAVYETGTITATVGERVSQDQSFDFRAFVDWYFSMLFTNKNYGLPASVNWLMRIFVTITLFSAFLVARDILPF